MIVVHVHIHHDQVPFYQELLPVRIQLERAHRSMK